MNEQVFWLYFSCVATFLLFFAIRLGHSNVKSFFASIAILINSVVSSVFAIQALRFGNIDFIIHNVGLMGDIAIRIDSLSAWFILIVNFTSVTGAIYGSGYLKGNDSSNNTLTLHWILFVLFHLSMVWVCMLQNGFAFLIAWEMMSLSSMLLVIFEHKNVKTLKAGINYLVQMHISVVFLTIGFIWVYFEKGTFGFDAIDTFFVSKTNIWLFLVFFIGFGIKAGFVPLHTWLPHAHPAAPSHVSGVMSGVIVKMGIYGIFRMVTYLHSDYLILGEIVLSISIITGLYGIANAAVQRDYKRLLAYCTIENIGIIGIGIGLGLIGMNNGSSLLFYLGFGGALLHVLNHSLFKSLLFFSAGSVYQQTHTRNMDKLGGVIRYMPHTAIAFLVGALAIGGLPPFNGFVSEFIIYCGMLEGMKTNDLSQLLLIVLSFAGICVIGGVSIITFTKSFGTIFLGNERKCMEHKPQEVSKVMLVPMYVIIAVMVSVAVLPSFYLNVIYVVLSGFENMTVPKDVSILNSYANSIFMISILSICIIVFAGIIWFLRKWATRNKKIEIGETWGCAYVVPNNRMQYTGKAFSKTFGKIFNFFLIEKKDYEEIAENEIFPTKRKYKSRYYDFFETRFIDIVTHRLVYTANYFKFIQNGRIQSYMLYGIVFIITILMLTFLNILK